MKKVKKRENLKKYRVKQICVFNKNKRYKLKLNKQKKKQRINLTK